MSFFDAFMEEVSDSIIWGIIMDYSDKLADDCCNEIMDYLHVVAMNVDKKMREE